MINSADLKFINERANDVYIMSVLLTVSQLRLRLF
jgi:hypothetical protein